MRKIPVIVLASLLLAPASWATMPLVEQDPLGELSARFLDGYAIQDEQQVTEKILAALTTAVPQSSVFNANADLSPLALAVLALEAEEGTRDRVRYRIRYAIEQVANPPKESLLPISLIQVDRFSLGGAIRQDILAAYGAENVAPAEKFDAGPHVSWRLVTRPVMGIRADMLAAGRSELSDVQAQDMQCLSNACLSTALELEHAAPWGELQAVNLTHTLPYPVNRDGLLTPAAAIELLSDGSDFSGDKQSNVGDEELIPLDEQAYLADQQPDSIAKLPSPIFEAVIEINLGQDSALEAVMRHAVLNDDSVSATWARLVAMPADKDPQHATTHRASAYECQRGPKFPAEGGLCL